MNVRRFMVVASCIVVLLLSILSLNAVAIEKFQITYRLESSSAGHPGGLLVSVYNTSGQAIRNAIIAVSGPNKVTFDNHQIRIGDLADGQHAAFVEPFRIPAEAVASLELDARSLWTVEYTNPEGTRVQVPVAGARMQ